MQRHRLSWSPLSMVLLLLWFRMMMWGDSVAGAVVVTEQEQQEGYHHHDDRRRDRGQLSFALLLNEESITPLLSSLSSLFWPVVVNGWKHRCEVLGLDCSRNITVPRAITIRGGHECASHYRTQIEEWIEQGVSGISLKPCEGAQEEMRELYQMAAEQGVFITTLETDDQDHNLSSIGRSSSSSSSSRRMGIRSAYVGTDQEFLGRTMAKLVRQLHPEGGTFALVGRKPGRTEGFIHELTQYNHRDDWPHFFQVTDPAVHVDPINFHDDDYGQNYFALLSEIAQLNPTALIFLSHEPMLHINYTDFVRTNRQRNMTLIATTDGSDVLLAYLNTRLVDALVGQLPYEMGLESAQVLYDLIQGKILPGPTTKIHTNLVAYTLIPTELPTLDVDENLIGNLKYVGYVCFSIVAFSVLACIAWTLRHRSTLIVRAAQPMFLVMVAVGVIIMAGALIPLTMDDGGSMIPMNRTKAVAICMTVPWLAFSGFTLTFSALFSKLCCVHRLFHPSAKRFRFSTSSAAAAADNGTTAAVARITALDVFGPFLFLLSSNILILTLWTVLDPLVYSREEDVGTDYWSRVISTYGACHSENNNVAYYLAPLLIINFIVLAVAGWQAVQLRNIQLEFSEAKYIALAVGGLLQAFLMGTPIVVVVRDQPQAYYMVLTMILFLLSEGLLLLIFLPKIFLQREYGNMSESDQRRLFELRVRQARLNTAGNNSSMVAERYNNYSDHEKDEKSSDAATSVSSPAANRSPPLPPDATTNEQQQQQQQQADRRTFSSLSSSNSATQRNSESGK